MVSDMPGYPKGNLEKKIHYIYIIKYEETVD
jgi:hypothetical protein